MKVAVRISKRLSFTCQLSVILKKILTTEYFFNIQRVNIIQFTSRRIVITKRGQYVPLRKNVGSFTSQSVSDVIARSTLIFGKYSYIHFWCGYDHQMSAAGTPLEEEFSGHLSPDASDVIICSHVIDKYRQLHFRKSLLQ